jgi:20S proteasome subunit beta 7
MSDNGPKQNTQQPIVTGTSVIAVKFKDGVVMAADNLGPSYLFYTNTVAKSD